MQIIDDGDIIVWNGVVAEFETIKKLLRAWDYVRIATEEEVNKYRNINK